MSGNSRFTNRQTVAIVTAVSAAVIAYPAFGYAASLSSVKIVNKGHSATVTKKGALSTALQDAKTGKTAKISKGGAQLVGGTVTATPARPAAPLTLTGSNDPVQVPAHATFVIQTVSCRTLGAPAAPVGFVLDYVSGGQNEELWLNGATQDPDLGGGSTWSVTHDVTLYADGGTAISCKEGGNQAQVTLSGYRS